MKARLLWLITVAFLVGCAHDVQTAPKANADMLSASNVFQLKQKLGHESAAPAREKLNRSLAALQQVTATNSAQAQQAWEAQVYAASPNVTAKVTTMINPMDTKGRIMEEQILTYYDNGTMRYATNFFNHAK